MQLFDHKACLTAEGLRALAAGGLDALGRLEAAEHLAYCDRCVRRYTMLLERTGIGQPPAPLAGPVLRTVWAQTMRNLYGRAAVAGVAAVLALGVWQAGVLGRPVRQQYALERWSSWSEPLAPPQQNQNTVRSALDEAGDALAGSWQQLQQALDGHRRLLPPNEGGNKQP